MIELILGGVRSGKSRYAEQRAHAGGLAVTVIATATAADAEMHERIAAHRRDRPRDWVTVETPYTLAASLREHARTERCLVVDCLTLWLTNLLCADDAQLFLSERRALIEVLPTLPGHIVLVSNETSLGIVPAGALTRRYCDEAGRLHQELAQLCDRVVLVIAGLPQLLKGSPP